MPCSDSSSSMTIRVDHKERFVSFDFSKVTCGRGITANTGYSKYCRGKSLTEIIALPYEKAAKGLRLKGEEARFILYLEWDALRSAVAQYLGIKDNDIDTDRCLILAISHDEKGQEIVVVVLPPKEMPKILPCHQH